MRTKTYLVFAYLIYLFSTRFLLNVTFGPWLESHISGDTTVGSIVWGGVKLVHWGLPLVIYLCLYNHELASKLRKQLNITFSWKKLLIFLGIWSFLIFLQYGFKFKSSISFYDILNNVLITALIEEFVFRGYVLTQLGEGMGFQYANILQSIFFSLNHLPWLYSIGLTASAVVLGTTLLFYIFFGYIAGIMTKKSGSLIPAMLLHAVNNFAVTLVK